MKMNFLGILNKHDFTSNTGKFLSKQGVIDLRYDLVKWNSCTFRKEWKAFANSLSKSELEVQWDEYWQD